MHVVKRRHWHIRLVPVLLLLLFGGLVAWNRVPASAEVKSGLPFSLGERLVYSVEWDSPWFLFFLPPMDAGEAELHLTGETEYNGQKVLKISFKARSSGMLVKLFGVKVDDEFIFLADPDSLCTLTAAKRIREGKHKKQVNVEYLRDARQLHFREIDEAVAPPKLTKDEVKSDIPECVQDPFSALYAFRRLTLAPGYEQAFKVGNDDKIKEVKSRVDGQEVIECPAGMFTAWRVTTAALMGGLFKEGGQFKIWLTADERKLPVQFEAKVHLGRAIGKLKRAQ